MERLVLLTPGPKHPARGPARGDPQRRCAPRSSRARRLEERAPRLRARVHPRAAARARLEHLAHRRGDRHRAREPVAQDARSSGSRCRVSERRRCRVARRGGCERRPRCSPRIHAIAARELRRALVRGRLRRGVRAAPRPRVWVARDGARRACAATSWRGAPLDEVARALPRGRAAARGGAARRRALLVAALAAERAQRRAHRAPRGARVERRRRSPSTSAHGFRSVGRRRRYYPDGEDALLLARGARARAARGSAA